MDFLRKKNWIILHQCALKKGGKFEFSSFFSRITKVPIGYPKWVQFASINAWDNLLRQPGHPGTPIMQSFTDMKLAILQSK